MAVANVRTDFPRLDLSSSTGMDLSQIFVSPVSLGWHFSRADLTFDYGFYAPTGRYTAGASDNTSLGMWCNELSLRSTVFFDEAKAWHAAASLYYDVNGKKKDTDWTTGDPLTLMWGVGGNYGSGKSLFKGWAGRTHIYAVGPEFTTLQGALTIRYFWQFGGKFSTQGQGLYVQFAMPI
ncbi:MAG: transporter [Thermoanaerobaculia bacterium]